MVVEREGLGGERQQRIVQCSVAPRRGVAVTVIRLVLDARTWHDLRPGGRGGSAYAAAGSLGWRPPAPSGLARRSPEPSREAQTPRDTGGALQGHPKARH